MLRQLGLHRVHHLWAGSVLRCPQCHVRVSLRLQFASCMRWPRRTSSLQMHLVWEAAVARRSACAAVEYQCWWQSPQSRIVIVHGSELLSLGCQLEGVASEHAS